MAFNASTQGINYSNGTNYSGPQSYVNFTMPNQTPIYNNGIFTRFVKNEQEAASLPNPVNGCAFYILDNDDADPVIFVKYADGRPMEIYDMVIREAPKAPEYLTVDTFNKIFNEKMDEMSRRFVTRREKNGQ